MSTDARLLHRLLGPDRAAGEHRAGGRGATPLRARRGARRARCPRCGPILLADSLAPADVDRTAPCAGPGAGPLAAVVAALQPAELRRAGDDRRRRRRGLPDGSCVPLFGIRVSPGRCCDAAERVGVVASVVARRSLVVLVASVVLSVSRSLLTSATWCCAATRDVLHLQHGLLRRREHTFDMRRLRGGTLREPLLVRMFGGARLDAVMTGVDGAGEASLLLPPCPAATARGGADRADRRRRRGRRCRCAGTVRPRPAGAGRGRWRCRCCRRRPGLAFVVGTAGVRRGSGSPWRRWRCAARCWPPTGSRALGHRVGGGWLVARAGSLERRRDCIAAEGIIGWTVRQTLFQRRAGVATLIAATAAGRQALPGDRRAGRPRVVDRGDGVAVGGRERVGRDASGARVALNG